MKRFLGIALGLVILAGLVGCPSQVNNVTVTPAPSSTSITSFQASPVTVGNPSNFAWAISNASGTLTCSLDPGDGSGSITIADCANNTSHTYTYSRANTYSATLTVQGAGISKMTSVTVNARPSNVYAGGGYGFAGVYGVAIDHSGNIWITDSAGNGGCGSVTELPAGDFTGPVVYADVVDCDAVYGTYGFEHPHGVAADHSGNIWIANEDGGSNYTGSVIELPAGAPTKPVKYTSGIQFPFGAAVDAAGNIWITDSNTSYVTEFPAGNPTGYNDFLAANSGASALLAVAADPSGNIWVPNAGSSGGESVAELPVGNRLNPVIYSGYKYWFLEPYGVATDASGNVWVSSYGNDVTELPAGNPTNPTVYKGSNYAFNEPWGVAADASGNIYIANSLGNSVTELPAGNYTNPIVYSGGSYGFNKPMEVAVDASGNVWITNNGGGSVTELH